MKIGAAIFSLSQVLSHVQIADGACNADEHHPQNGGYFIEGINGFGSIVDPTSTDKRKITNSTWTTGIPYANGSLKYCTGPYCSETCRNDGCPDIIYGHTCSMIRFCYDNDSGSDVWLMPNEMAMAKCDFSEATQVGTTTDGSDDDCFNYYVEEDADLKLYLFASKAGCDTGQKAAVSVDDFATVGDACYGMGLTTSRIKSCTCNYEDREMSTLSEPCHSQFIAGCNYHFPDLGDDDSCCDTKSCIGNHLNFEHPIGKAMEDERKTLCRDDIPGRCVNQDESDCCTNTCTQCGTDISPFNEWAACDAGNATSGIGECGYGGHGGYYSKYECDFSKCDADTAWAVTGDLFKDWIGTVDKAGAMKNLNIVEFAVAAGQFKTLVTAVLAANLAVTLSGAGPFTVFAPTDAAFAQVANLDAIIADKDKLTSLLLDHVVAGKVVSTDVSDGLCLKSLGGNDICFSITDEGAYIAGAEIVDGSYDLEVSNGVVHAISSVIVIPDDVVETAVPGGCYDMDGGHVCGCDTGACTQDLCVAKGRIWTDGCPICDPKTCDAGGDSGVVETPMKNIVEIASASQDFSTLVAAVKAAGLVESLTGDGPFTVFAPNNAAFAKEGNLGAILSDTATLKELLLNHVVGEEILSAAVQASGGASFTTLGGKTVTITLTGTGATINDAVIGNFDIMASNGVIHEVYSVLAFEDVKESSSSSSSEEVVQETVVNTSNPIKAATAAPASSPPTKAPVTSSSSSAKSITSALIGIVALFFAL